MSRRETMESNCQLNRQQRLGSTGGVDDLPPVAHSGSPVDYKGSGLQRRLSAVAPRLIHPWNVWNDMAFNRRRLENIVRNIGA
jgi:hypothetical protein